MKIIRKAQAGSFESSDVLILLEPKSQGLGRKIEIESGVYKQYGDEIERLIIEVLNKYHLSDLHLKMHDKGAIEPVIKARLETVIKRATGEQQGTLY